MGYSLILLNNSRSKAYLQTLCAFGFKPTDAIVFSDGNPVPASKQVHMCRLVGFRARFNMMESIYQTLERENISYFKVDGLDPNCEKSEAAISALSEDYVLYSGPAGVILKPNILNLGKKLIHAHPGLLPKYRGSTTIYYSLLLEEKAKCSVIVLNEGIDCGLVMFSKEYILEKCFLDYDVTVDSIVRAETLLELFESTDGNLALAKLSEQEGKANDFYIIHPLLKHLSTMKASGVPKHIIREMLG